MRPTTYRSPSPGAAQAVALATTRPPLTGGNARATSMEPPSGRVRLLEKPQRRILPGRGCLRNGPNWAPPRSRCAPAPRPRSSWSANTRQTDRSRGAGSPRLRSHGLPAQRQAIAATAMITTSRQSASMIRPAREPLQRPLLCGTDQRCHLVVLQSTQPLTARNLVGPGVGVAHRDVGTRRARRPVHPGHSPPAPGARSRLSLRRRWRALSDPAGTRYPAPGRQRPDPGLRDHRLPARDIAHLRRARRRRCSPTEQAGLSGTAGVSRVIRRRNARLTLLPGASGVKVFATAHRHRTVSAGAAVTTAALGLAVGLTIVPQQHRLFADLDQHRVRRHARVSGMINEYRLAHDVDEVLGTHTSTASPAPAPPGGALHTRTCPRWPSPSWTF